MEGDQPHEPPAKRRKLLALSEVPQILQQQQQHRGKATLKEEGCQCLQHNKTELELKCTSGEMYKKVHDEEEDEATQIESSLPLYLNYIFGPFIGHCQLTEKTMHHSTGQGKEIAKQQVPLLESQGFLYTLPLSQKSNPPHPKEIETNECPQSPLLFASPVSPCKDLNSYLPSTLQTQERGSCAVSATALLERSISTYGSGTSGAPSTVCSGSPCHGRKLAVPISDFAMDVKTEVKAQLHGVVERVKEEETELCITEKVSMGNRKRSLSHLGSGSLSGGYTPPPLCTCLAQCTEADKNVSLFAIVLQVNPVMEVACKNGSMAGQIVQMSSLLLGDPSKAYFKLTLWREAAAWVERIAAGDITYFRNTKLKRWRKEVVGHTVMHSSVLNLHQPKNPLPAKVCGMVPLSSLESLKQWAMKFHAHLFEESTPKSQRPVYFRTSRELGMESVVHFRAKLVALVSSRVVVIADDPEREVQLYLLSSEASLWSTQLSGGVGEVWEFLYVAVTSEGTQGGCYLQTTSRSQLRSMKSGCEMAVEILKKFPAGVGNPFVTKGCSFGEVLLNRESGTFEFKAVALSSHFLLVDGLRLSLETILDSSGLELVSKVCQAVYVGCETCSRPLEQDENGVYCQCAACMVKKPGGYPSSSYYFRPLAIVLRDGTGCVEVTVTHAIVPKILGISAVCAVKAGLAEDRAQCERVKLAVRSFQEVSQCSDGNLWTVSCVISKDENSFLESVSLSVLDWTAS